MDSTLIEQEVIVELAKTAGIGEEVEAITEAAMRGEIDFDESFAQRVALLKGTSTDVLDDICSRLTLSTGARTTISALKALGYHTVLVSGGFTYFARYIAEQLGIDEVHANALDIEEGEVTGHVQWPIVNGAKKAAIVEHTAERLGIEMSQVVCVGDGANDLPMMALADLGVAYHAKPIVQARADAAINVTGLEGTLYALGYPALVPTE
jgi:phosphoserine phosphatase